MKKVALVTGASAGIGEETARYLSGRGYTVYGAARRLDRMEAIKAQGAKAISMDVTNEESMVKGINQIIQTEGRIDVLINNAGFGSYGALEEVSMTDAKYQMEVNVFGAARLMQLVLPHMRKQQYGKIVNISSIGGKTAFPMGSWYHASKFALEALSDSLRNEVKQFGIEVIVIEPGGIKSEWSGIAADNLKKVSGNGPYKSIVDKLDKVFSSNTDSMPGPDLIAKMIYKAVESSHPKTRYVGGHLAHPVMFMKKVLSDRMLDRVIMSQFS